jgi:predicted nucleotidyltransferase component of viral defense system
LDGTICGYPVTQDKLHEMLNDIISISADDNISFVVNTITPIMLDSNYECLRVGMTAIFEKLKISLKLDISTGDVITPRPIEFMHKLMFSDEQIEILAYNLETILAEKLETVLSRNIANTRPRDFYDIYIRPLSKPYKIC